MTIRGKAAIVGIGELKPSRTPFNKTSWGVIGEVAKIAVEDAGLRKEDIDGLLCEPSGGGGADFPAALAEYLQIPARYASSVGIMGASYAGMVWRAAAAIAAGMATNVLCVAGNNQSPAARRRTQASAPPTRISGLAAQFEEWTGRLGPNSDYALLAQRHAFEFGTTDAQRAKIAVDQRTNACVNPEAVFYGQPITVADVLNSRMISDPLRILECVMPVNGGEAFVVTSAERACSLRHPPAYILGAGEYMTHRAVTNHPRMTLSPVKRAAAQAFAMAGVSPRDINAAEVYDCYTITVLITLEDAGFCPKGEGGPFVVETDLTYKGKLPVNTNGGQLSFGQSGGGGMEQVIEGTRQIMGRGGARQVPNCELVYVNGNGGVMSTQVGIVLGSEL